MIAAAPERRAQRGIPGLRFLRLVQDRYQRWYYPAVATNLRLRRDVADAVRAAAIESGRSQQEIIREAIDRYLALAPISEQESDLRALILAGTVRPPRAPYRKAGRRIRLPAGVTSADLLDRDDGF